MTTQTDPLAIEPTPEFNEACLAIVSGWDAGEMPTPEALRRLGDLSRQAAQSAVVANQGRAEHMHGYIHHYLGNLNTSIMHYEKARRLFVRINNRKRIATIDLNQGENYRAKGEFTRARNLYRSAYETALEMNDVALQSFALTNEGWSLLSLKDYVNARNAFQQAFEATHSFNPDEESPEGVRSEILYGLAEIDLIEGNPTQAWQNGMEALRYAQISKAVKNIGFAWRVLGDALTQLGSPQDSELPTHPDEYYRNALVSFREIGAEGEVARTVFCHAKSFAYRGSKLKAAQMFKEAMVIFTRLGMTHDAVRAAEAQLRVS